MYLIHSKVNMLRLVALVMWFILKGCARISCLLSKEFTFKIMVNNVSKIHMCHCQGGVNLHFVGV